MNILVKFPTRNRPEKFKKCLSAWLSKLSGEHRVHFLISLHDDDPSRNEVIHEPYNLRPGTSLEFVIGKITTKIEAANFGLTNRNFDILVQGMDDLYPLAQAWDDIMVKDVENYFPCLDGVVNYWDGHRPDFLPVVFSIGWNFFRRFPYLWNPSYVSVYADNELFEIANCLHKFISSPSWLKATDNILMDHRHPYWTGEKADAMLQHTESFYSIDRTTFEARKSKNFDIIIPKLSILICSDYDRIIQLKSLVKQLYDQIFNLQNSQDVEVLYLLDNKVSVDTKRKKLLEMGRGKFTIFLKDNDIIGNDYIEKTIKSLEVQTEKA